MKKSTNNIQLSPITIIVSQGDEDKKIELTTYWDSDLEDWKKIFQIILNWLEFDTSLINDFFNKKEVSE